MEKFSAIRVEHTPNFVLPKTIPDDIFEHIDSEVMTGDISSLKVEQLLNLSELADCSEFCEILLSFLNKFTKTTFNCRTAVRSHSTELSITSDLNVTVGKEELEAIIVAFSILVTTVNSIAYENNTQLLGVKLVTKSLTSETETVHLFGHTEPL